MESKLDVHTNDFQRQEAEITCMVLQAYLALFLEWLRAKSYQTGSEQGKHDVAWRHGSFQLCANLQMLL